MSLSTTTDLDTAEGLPWDKFVTKDEARKTYLPSWYARDLFSPSWPAGLPKTLATAKDIQNLAKEVIFCACY